MNNLPKIIATSVVRSSQKGDSHGGIYLIDLENSNHEKVVDWNDSTIKWDGRGGERGMRGISLYKDRIITVSASEILFFDKNLKLEHKVSSPHLKGLHEICVEFNYLYLTSTSTDSIIIYDLEKDKFVSGYKLIKASKYRKKLRYAFNSNKININGDTVILKKFNPNKSKPMLSDVFHINMVYTLNGEIYFSGTKLDKSLKIKHGKIQINGNIPFTTHNCQPYKNKLVYNSTGEEFATLRELNGDKIVNYYIDKFDEGSLLNNNLPSDYARQAFARGLCIYNEYIIIGASPATIHVFNIHSGELIKKVNISMDIRNAIHGLEVYTY